MSDKHLWVFYDSIAKIQSNALTKDEAQSTILKIRPQSVDRFFIWTQGWQNWQPLRTYLESDQKVFVSTFTVSRSNEQTMKAVAQEILEHTITRTSTQTQTSFPHSKEDTQTNTATNTKSYSTILLAEETISRYMRIDNQAVQGSADYSAKFDADDLTFSNIQKPSLDFSKLASKIMDTRMPRHELKIEVLLISQRGKTFRTRSKNISLSGALLEDTMPFEFYDIEFDIVVMSTLTKDPKKARVKLQGKAIVAGSNRSQRLQFINPTDDQKSNLQCLLQDYLEATKNNKKSA